MNYKIQFDCEQYRHLQNVLFPAHGGEGFAFALAGMYETCGTRVLVAHEIIDVPERAVKVRGFRYQIDWEFFESIINRAAASKLVTLQMHSHPFSDTKVRFSQIDMNGYEEAVRFILPEAPGGAYSALVFGKRSVKALVWTAEGSLRGFPADVIRVGVEDGKAVIPLLSSDYILTPLEEEDYKRRLDRQLRAITPDRQRLYRDMKIVVVGAGGLGSYLATPLVHNGAMNVTIVDPDLVEVENRINGGTMQDVVERRPKVDVAVRTLKGIAPSCNVVALKAPLQSELALEAVKSADLVYGCLDTDVARKVLNEMCCAYSKILIDLGTGVDPDPEKGLTIDGRVTVSMPGWGCLRCAGAFNWKKAEAQLRMPPDEVHALRGEYVRGVKIKDPSIASINGIIANYGPTLLLHLVAGLGPVPQELFFNATTLTVVRGTFPKNPECEACVRLAGLADRAGLEKYWDRTATTQAGV
jgi:hypothetical protein